RDHVAALAAVAAVRPAILDELLAPERHAAVAAVAGADVDLGFVEEFHFVASLRLALALALHHRPLQRLADVALVGDAFALGILAYGIEQFFRNPQIERLLLRLEFEAHPLCGFEVTRMQVISKILLEKRFGLFIGLEHWKFLFHIERSPSCAYNAR